jgi:hypothetical protein
MTPKTKGVFLKHHKLLSPEEFEAHIRANGTKSDDIIIVSMIILVVTLSLYVGLSI